MIKIKNASKSFLSQKCLDDVSLELNLNERIIIMGQNGAGKTTLIRAILGEYILDGGEISIDGYSPLKKRENALKSIGFVPQLPPPIKLSVGELIEYARVSSGASEAKIYEFCEKLNFDLKANVKKIFYKLSGGMKQKVLIAIALARNPKIFIFDEPTANLDMQGRESFYELLQEFKDDRLMIFISHRIEEVQNIVNRKIEMDLGKVVSDETI